MPDDVLYSSTYKLQLASSAEMSPFRANYRPPTLKYERQRYLSGDTYLDRAKTAACCHRKGR